MKIETKFKPNTLPNTLPKYRVLLTKKKLGQFSWRLVLKKEIEKKVLNHSLLVTTPFEFLFYNRKHSFTTPLTKPPIAYRIVCKTFGIRIWLQAQKRKAKFDISYTSNQLRFGLGELESNGKKCNFMSIHPPSIHTFMHPSTHSSVQFIHPSLGQ